MGKVDSRELKKWLEQVQKLEDTKITEEFIKSCIRKLALTFLIRAIKLSPVDSGHLRRMWIGEEGTETPSVSEIEAFLNDVTIEKKGSNYYITLSNNVEYAVYVNYGHRQTPGRYVPAIGKRLKNGWVEGQFFLEKAENFINRNKHKILNSELESFLKEYFGND